MVRTQKWSQLFLISLRIVKTEFKLTLVVFPGIVGNVFSAQEANKLKCPVSQGMGL